MPRKSIEVSKHDRIQAIRDVLKKSGKLTGSAIRERISAQFRLEPGVYHKERFRTDMLALVRSGEVEIDEEVHPFAYCLMGGTSKIIGEDFLTSIGGHFIVPSLIKEEVSLYNGVLPHGAFKEHYIYFEISGNFLALRLNKEGLPLKILISRGSHIEDKKILELMEEQFGKRALALFIPIPSLSSTKSKDQMGHLLVEIKGEDDISITDLGSTNGTEVGKINIEATQEMLENGALLGKQTMKESWANIESTMLKLEKIKAQKSIGLSLSAYVQLGDDFPLLFI